MALPNCVICLDQLLSGNDSVVAIRCGHMFHNECIKGWARMKKVCPICRDAVKCRPIRLFLDQENVAVTATVENRTNERPTVTIQKPAVRQVIDLMSVDEDDDDEEDVLSDDTDNRMDDDDDFYSDIEPEIGQLAEMEDRLAQTEIALSALSSQLNAANLLTKNLSLALKEKSQDIKSLHLQQEALQSANHQLRDQLREAKEQLNRERFLTTQQKKDIQALQEENDSMKMRKIAVDLQRILTDLDEEEAVQYGSRFRHFSDEDLGYRIEALIRQAKLEQARSNDMVKTLELRSTQYEQLERQYRRLQAAFDAKCEEMDNHKCIGTEQQPKKLQLEPPMVKPPILFPKAKPISVPSAPAKFAGVKKSFQVPDGLGGTKKSIDTKFGRLDL